VSINDGRIISGQASFFSSHPPLSRVVDLGGNILAPGLIDVQINGAFGVDFSELEVDAADHGEAAYVQGLEKVARRIVATGCTSFVPTVITQKEELYSKVSEPLKWHSSFSFSDFSGLARQPAGRTSWGIMPKAPSSIPIDEALTLPRSS
jgi:N-acetylglucosamine-6-phosphate deacetylase